MSMATKTTVALPIKLDNAAYQRILDAMSTAILLLDSNNRLRYVNPAGEMLFAISARHLQGFAVQQLFTCEIPLQDMLDEALATHHPFTRHELPVTLHGSTEIMTLDLTAIPMQDSHNEDGLLIELIRMDQLLRISRDESLIAQQQATQELLKGLAHEVKNPLGGLRGAAQLLERQLSDPDLKEYTRVIIDEADRLQLLVDRMTGPRTIPQQLHVNVHEILEHVRQLVLADNTHQVYIRRDYDPSIPDIKADPGQIIQAILNITRNAVQALTTVSEVADKQDPPQITYRTRILRNYTLGNERYRLVANIQIVDNGPGIEKSLRDKIFFPMVTGRAEGTGLGLSIAQSIIQQHGGLIECHSHPGETIFSIILPVQLSDEPSAMKHARESTST